MATVKKAQKGMTMKQLKAKYPSADTTAKGDVRGSEMNAYAPKKVVQKYSDTYSAFEKKFGNKPAKDKKGGVVKSKMKMGGKVKKAQNGEKLLPGQKPSKKKPVNNYDNGPIFGGNKELPKNKKEASELRKKNESENKSIGESLKNAFNSTNANRYSKGSMKKGGTMKKSMSMGGKMNMGGMMKKGGKMSKGKKC